MAVDLRCVRRWPSTKAREWAQAFVAAFCADERVDAIVAVGSAVRGVGHETSDLDLVLVYRGEQPSLGTPPIDVDVRAFARDQVEAKVAEGHDLLGWALRFGVAVCERNGYWTKLHTRWLNRVPLPSAGVSLARAERAERLARELLASGDEDAALELAVAMLTHRARVCQRPHAAPPARGSRIDLSTSAWRSAALIRRLVTGVLIAAAP